jgi:hypothetical protein
MRVGRATVAAVATLTLAGCGMGSGATPSRIPLQGATASTSTTSTTPSTPDSGVAAVNTTTATPIHKATRTTTSTSRPAATPAHKATTSIHKATRTTTSTSRPMATPTHKVVRTTTSMSARAGVVHPGAFCHEGDRGVTTRGTPMTCSEGRWRASTKTTTSAHKAAKTAMPAPATIHEVITITTPTSTRVGRVHPGAFRHQSDRGATARGTPMTRPRGRWRASTKTMTASRPTTTPTHKAIKTTAPAPTPKAGDEDAKSDTTASAMGEARTASAARTTSTAPTRHASATRAAATHVPADSTLQHRQTDDGGQHGSF